MSDIRIIPIFDQSVPGIWDDFLHIRAASMEFNYNYELESDELARALSEYKQEFKSKSYNFAFGAYDDAKMVGFIRGYGARNVATIKCLYVLPSHQRQHIGHNLLLSAERSIAPAYKNIELLSLWHAENFYKAHKYTSIYGANTYAKKIELPHCADVALFGFPARIARMCAPLSHGLDISALIVPHAPLFAYFNVDATAEGLLVGNTHRDKPVLLQTQNDHPNDWARLSLTRTFNNYRANIAQLNERGR